MYNYNITIYFQNRVIQHSVLFYDHPDPSGQVQHVVHDGLIFLQRVYVQIQDGHQTAVQRREQRRRPCRLLRTGQETAQERIVRLHRRLPTGGTDIRVARQRVVLHTADRQQGHHTGRPRPRAD